ncbi:MAG TPA: carbon monoxide dehydrogenase subunit G [Jatrophihabitantaceae bacterium]|jgi:carbon monoxide dehydrogenase subunit G|nr:carbon monoxide dehydrogenase subunit G [Jatrophihabitantaceae bacterium]
MKVSGDTVLHADAETVWRTVTDPQVLVRTIPGCERLEVTGPDAYAMTVSAGVASIKGTYDGAVALTDQNRPSSFVLRASGAGASGTIRTDVAVTLSDGGNGTTSLRYDADADVGGMVGGVGQRVLTSVAKKMAGQFFANVDDVLTGAAPVAPATAAAGATPGVFTAPPRARAVPSGGFVKGVLVGAGVALAGVLVGTLIGRRR